MQVLPGHGPRPFLENDSANYRVSRSSDPDMGRLTRAHENGGGTADGLAALFCRKVQAPDGVLTRRDPGKTKSSQCVGRAVEGEEQARLGVFGNQRPQSDGFVGGRSPPNH